MKIKLSQAIDGLTLVRQVAGCSDHAGVRLHPAQTLR